MPRGEKPHLPRLVVMDLRYQSLARPLYLERFAVFGRQVLVRVGVTQRILGRDELLRRLDVPEKLLGGMGAEVIVQSGLGVIRLLRHVHPVQAASRLGKLGGEVSGVALELRRLILAVPRVAVVDEADIAPVFQIRHQVGMDLVRVFRLGAVALARQPVPYSGHADGRQTALGRLDRLLLALGEVEHRRRIVFEIPVRLCRDVAVVARSERDTVLHSAAVGADRERRTKAHTVELVVSGVAHRHAVMVAEVDAVAADLLVAVRLVQKRDDLHILPRETGTRQVRVDPRLQRLALGIAIHGGQRRQDAAAIGQNAGGRCSLYYRTWCANDADRFRRQHRAIKLCSLKILPFGTLGKRAAGPGR